MMILDFWGDLFCFHCQLFETFINKAEVFRLKLFCDSFSFQIKRVLSAYYKIIVNSNLRIILIKCVISILYYIYIYSKSLLCKRNTIHRVYWKIRNVDCWSVRLHYYNRISQQLILIYDQIIVLLIIDLSSPFYVNIHTACIYPVENEGEAINGHAYGDC